MSPYRIVPKREAEWIQPGQRWGATRWVKFKMRHPAGIHVLSMILLYGVIVPIVCTIRALMLKDPFDW